MAGPAEDALILPWELCTQNTFPYTMIGGSARNCTKNNVWLMLYRKLSGKYCPDELEEHRREINEPRRRPKEITAKMSNPKIFVRNIPIDNRREFNLLRRRP